MDPVTQGAIGAIASQSLRKENTLLPITVMAALSAMSPDLDVLIRSSHDPLMSLEYHRQFSHSLFFIPLGALLCSLVLHPLLGRRGGLFFFQSYLVCLIAYATHGLLDSCTTYGTLLLWPFSDERFAWGTIGIVDFIYTIPVLIGVIFSIKINSTWPARILIIWVFLYPTIGHFQHLKAEQAASLFLENKLSKAANILPNSKTTIHPKLSQVLHISAKPTVMNLVLWKVIYETDKRFYVDAVRVGFFQSAKNATYFPGDSIDKITIEKDLPWLEKSSQQAKDIERFSKFSMGYLAKEESIPTNKIDAKNSDTALGLRVIDIRYSMLPNEIAPLWSIGLDPQATQDQHVSYERHTNMSKEQRRLFLKLLFPN